jgi:hypothetical protein
VAVADGRGLRGAGLCDSNGKDWFKKVMTTCLVEQDEQLCT